MTGAHATYVSHAQSLVKAAACQDVGEAKLLMVVQGVHLQILVCILVITPSAHEGG